MKMQIPKYIKSLFVGKNKKRNIWITIVAVILIIIIFFVLSPKNNNASIQTGFITKQNLQETVLSTGQVVSSTDLALSFQSSGVVRKILVKEGDKVKQGQLLASLDAASVYASLTSAQGSLIQAQANYDKLLDGATQQNIQVVKDSIASSNQDLTNAYNGAINTLNAGYTAVYNADFVAKAIQDAYFTNSDVVGLEARNAKMDLDNILQNIKSLVDVVKASGSRVDIDSTVPKEIVALSNAYNDINIIRVQTDQDTYKDRIPDAQRTSLDAQKTAISTALTSVTALQQSIASLKLVLQREQDQLSVTTAPPTQAEIDLARGQVMSAQGQVDAASAVYNNSIIRAPADGTITQVDIKMGELSTPSKEAIILQDVGSLHAEANISEANIATLQVGQSIDYTLDALGPDVHFSGTVLTINPASNVISGVVNYLVKGSLDNVPNVKPGMTVNMTVLVAKKDNVLAVPSTAVINRNNKQYVKVIDNAKNKTFHEVEVKTGLQADGGLIEILSGLNDGQEIVIYMKSK
jgi:HlyD family secretion protein